MKKIFTKNFTANFYAENNFENLEISKFLSKKILKILFLLLVLTALFFFGMNSVFAEENKKILSNQNALPEIAVIVPIYNTENYVKKCIDSITGQTFKNIDIICINDGSSDNSFKILSDLKKKDKRITLVDFKKNKGVSAARNKGLEIAVKKGIKCVSFIDSDDYIEPNTYEKCLKRMKETKSDAVIFDAAYSKSEKKEENEYDGGFKALSAGIWNSRSFVWNKIYSMNLIGPTRFDESMTYAEDACFNISVLARAKKVLRIPDKFYHYIRRVGSANSQDRAKKLIGALQSYSNITDDWHNHGIREHDDWLFTELMRSVYSKINNLANDSFKKQCARKVFEIYRKMNLKKYASDDRMERIKTIFACQKAA